MTEDIRLDDIIFTAKSVCVDGFEYNGEVKKVKGNAMKLIKDLYFIGRVATEPFPKGCVKFSECFKPDYGLNKERVSVRDIASLLLYGGSTDSYEYSTKSVNCAITVSDLTRLLNDLYLNWYEGEGIEDFPSYRLCGLVLNGITE